MVIAPDTVEFLRHKWWQILILALPFLGFLRLASLVRLARTARVLSWSVRATRTAGSELRARLYWLAAIHAIVVLSSAEVLVEYGPRHLSLLTAIHAAALGATTGQPLGFKNGFARTLEVGLAIYAVAFFAAIAGALGAFFIERRRDAEHKVGA
jgi:voltage-gated potassium channel